MKTLLFPLAVVLALAVTSTSSAAVVVRAGGVRVAVGARPYYRAPVVARPVVAPVVAPRPVVVAPPAPVWSAGALTPAERAEIRTEAQELRQQIRRALWD